MIDSVSRPILEKHNKFITTLIGALLFGFGWHIRGSGTSDPSVAMLLLLLYLSVLFGPRKKFNAFMFGLIILVFRALRRPWGTLVGQAGIPGLFPGEYDGFGISVPWWQGYFWLFLCGAAWATLSALLLGGYMFTKKNKFKLYDIWMSLLLFGLGIGLGLLIGRAIIPHISPDAYQVYVSGVEGSARNYQAMMDNFSVAFAIIPVLIYLGFAGKDWKFVGNSLVIIVIFGFGLSIADIWQALFRHSPTLSEIPFNHWGMWEFTTGFVIGLLILPFFYRKTNKLPETKEIDFPSYPKDSFGGKLLTYLISHFVVFLFGIQESFIGGLGGVFDVIGLDTELHTWMGIPIILILDIPLYILYHKGYILKKFKEKSFQEKSIIWLISLLPFYFLCYIAREIVAGSLFPINIRPIVSYIDILSFIIVETYLIVIYSKFKKR